MDELEHSVGLLVARFTADPTQILYDTQVVATTLDSGAIEVGYAARGMVLCRRHVYVVDAFRNRV